MDKLETSKLEMRWGGGVLKELMRMNSAWWMPMLNNL